MSHRKIKNLTARKERQFLRKTAGLTKKQWLDATDKDSKPHLGKGKVFRSATKV